MKLVEESIIQRDYDIIEEGVGQDKVYKIVGPYQTFDTDNVNGNIYPLANVKGAWDKYIEEDVAQGRAIGELNHPHKAEIDFDRIVHKITDLKYVGKELIGTSKIMNRYKSDVGKIACNLIDEKIPFGVSIRALGTFNSKREMQNDFKVLAVDLVFNPSNYSSMVDPILESIDYNIDSNGNIFIQKAVENLKKEVSRKKKSDLAVADAIKNLFHTF